MSSEHPEPVDFDNKRLWGPTPRYPAVLGYRKPETQAMTVIAGPCSVENPDQIEEVAEVLGRLPGVSYLRGGIWRAGTYPPPPEDFGLVKERVKWLSRAARRQRLKSIVEVLDVRHLDYLDRHVDAFQVGARHMQDYALLTELSKTDKVVTLKRNMGSTLDEFLGACEYLARGRCKPVLIERGGVSNLNHVRWDLSVSLIAAAKRLTGVPILVDASHGTGRRDLVAPMTLAGLAAGADGFLIECHPRAEKSATDTDQAFPLQDFPEFLSRAERLWKMVGAWNGEPRGNESLVWGGCGPRRAGS